MQNQSTRRCWRLMILGVWLALPAFADGGKRRADDCDGPTTLAEVTVEVGENGLFCYTLYNRHSSVARRFELGIGETREMGSQQENIPRRVDSPVGWEGRHIFLHESVYMQIVWRALSPEYRIAPGTARSGFDLEMPERHEKPKPLFDVSGREAVPLDMEKAPFQVVFEYGKCVWGRTRLPRAGESPPSPCSTETSEDDTARPGNPGDPQLHPADRGDHWRQGRRPLRCPMSMHYEF